MKFFLYFLVFVTLWIIIGAATVYLVHRRRPPFSGGRGTGLQACCLEVPCSDDCAREHQRQRDMIALEHSKIVRELGQIVQAGRELEPPPVLAGPPDS